MISNTCNDVFWFYEHKGVMARVEIGDMELLQRAKEVIWGDGSVKYGMPNQLWDTLKAYEIRLCWRHRNHEDLQDTSFVPIETYWLC